MNLPTKKLLKNVQSSRYIALIPNIKEEKTQKFTTTVFTILALIFFGLFAIEPTLSTIANLQKQLADDKFTETKLEQKINNLSVLQQKYASLQNDLPNIYASLPQKSEIPLLFGQIQAIADSSNITISGLQSSQVNLTNDSIANKKYVSFTFRISALGTYENIKTFLNRVINMQRMVTVNNLSLNKVNLADNNSLQLNIQAKAYFKQ